MNPVLVEVVRNGLVESVHRGSVATLAADGTARLRGSSGHAIWPRSTNKPLQAVGMLRAGLPASGELLAISAASHSGEDEHVGAVTRLLAAVGLDPSYLDNIDSLPGDEAAAAQHLRAGGRPDRLRQNCSGKHAAMLATCVRNGWSLTTYREPMHPLQQALRATVQELAAEEVERTGTDGCGTPIFGISLAGVARAFARLVRAEPGSPERHVADAMRAHPQLVGGTGRHVTALMRAVPGLLAKDGAEGVYVAAVADGPTVAVKIDDGADRAAGPAVAAALVEAGVLRDTLDALMTSQVLGHGAPVGALTAAPSLRP